MDTETNNRISEFFLAEFSAIQERAIGFEEAKASRVNFYLVVVAGVVAGFSGLLDNAIIQINLHIAVLVATSLLLVLGLATMKQLVDFSIAEISLYRRAGRLRRWFVSQGSVGEPYLAFDNNDDKPPFDLSNPYLAFRGVDAVLLVLNSASAALFALSTFLHWVISPLWATITVFIILSGIAGLLQIRWVHHKLRIADERELSNVRFPSRSNDH